jgi:hypothetical protein
MKKTFLVALLLSTLAVAQSLVKADQGAPGNQGPWPVKVVGPVTVTVGGSDGGVTIVVGRDGGPVPVSQGSFPWYVTGADGGALSVSQSNGPWTFTGADGGAVLVSGTTTPAACGTPTYSTTSVGLAAVNCPGAQLAGRYSIVICNSLENPGLGSRYIKVRVDGTNPVMGTGNPGDVLGVGDCIPYYIPAGVIPKCIASHAATYATGLECK